MRRIAVVLRSAIGATARIELAVVPDDTHRPLLDRRCVYPFNRPEEFSGRFLGRAPARTTAGH